MLWLRRVNNISRLKEKKSTWKTNKMPPTLLGSVNVQFMLNIIDGNTTKCNMLRDWTQESTHIIIHNYAMPPLAQCYWSLLST